MAEVIFEDEKGQKLAELAGTAIKTREAPRILGMKHNTRTHAHQSKTNARKKSGHCGV